MARPGPAESRRIEGEIEILRPVVTVFDVVADECNEPRYNRRIRGVEQRGPWRILGPLLRRMGRRQEKAIWTSLKRYLEAGTEARR